MIEGAKGKNHGGEGKGGKVGTKRKGKTEVREVREE